MYTNSQLGVFAEEVSVTGARQYWVDTFASFCLRATHGDVTRPTHFYEVFLPTRPWWLYFDIEFNRTANPDMSDGPTTAAFVTALQGFLSEKSMPISVTILDSTTPSKYSKHILVEVACENNARAGVLASQFVAYAQSLGVTYFTAAAEKQDGRRVDVPIVDPKVYDRHRCLRLLFSSKFGKSQNPSDRAGWIQ